MKQKKKAKGVTLIEVIMSVALIAILIVPLSNVVLAAFQTNKNGEIKQKASFVGQKVLEEMEAYDELKLEDYGTDKIFKLLDGDPVTKSKTVDNKYTGSVTRDYLGKKFTVELTMEKDSNFNYDNSSQNTDNVYDLSYKLSETKNASDAIVNHISQEDKVNEDTTNIFTGNNLTLKVDNLKNVNVFEKNSDVKLLTDKLLDFTLNKGISINLDSTFSSTLNIDVDPGSMPTTYIYIIKDKDCTGSVNVTSTSGNIKVNRYMNINEGESIADLYNINVKVEGTLYKGKKIVTEVLFEGSTKKNIKFK